MKYYFLLLAIMGFTLSSCNNDNNNTDAAGEPAEVHPPSQAIPDTLQLVNDSAIVLDNRADSGTRARVGNSDSIRKNN